MANQKNRAAADAEKLYAIVPANFSISEQLGAISGFQSKLLLTEYCGRHYKPGSTPPVVWARWDICEDLAMQLKVKCAESKAGKRPHMS